MNFPEYATYAVFFAGNHGMTTHSGVLLPEVGVKYVLCRRFHLGIERGHRPLVITRKGGKVVTIPLAPRAARAIDLAVCERVEGPIFLAPDG